MSRTTGGPAARPQRRDRMVQPHQHDPYRAWGKYVDPTACRDCGASFHEGRWTWRPAPADAPLALCPACHRIRDDYPAGTVVLEGDFAREHEQDVRGLVQNLEEREKHDHPLKRVMDIREEGGALQITTTDVHLAHAIATALHRAYRGDLHCDWAEGETLLRATWRR